MKVYQRALALLYGGTVTIGTLIQTIFPVPHTVFADKRNPLNAMFVKRGWAWAVGLLLLWIPLASSSSLSSASRAPARRTLKSAVTSAYGRLLGATVYWAVLTQWCFGLPLLSRIHHSTGTCEGLEVTHLKTPKSCEASNGSWSGVDISGHCL